MKRPIDCSSTFSSEGSEKCRNRRRRRLLLRRLRTSVPPLFHPPPSPNKNTMPASAVDDAVFVREDIFRPPHFFAVYDGHGGSHVSGLCTEMMREFIAEELTRVQISDSGGGGFNCDTRVDEMHDGFESEWEDSVRLAVERGFERMQQEALLLQSTCSLCVETGSTCGSQPVDCRSQVPLPS